MGQTVRVKPAAGGEQGPAASAVTGHCPASPLHLDRSNTGHIHVWYYFSFYTRRKGKIPGCPVQNRTPGNPTVKLQQELLKSLPTMLCINSSKALWGVNM
ncbi:hypothetical protein FKM82_021007 [Ascaphus truei]